MERWLHILLETKARDFIPRTLFACFAKEAGFRVTIGWDVLFDSMMSQLPKGMVLDKDLSTHRLHIFQNRYNHGFGNIASDAESLSFLQHSANMRMSAETLDVAEQFYCWGSSQYEVIAGTHPKGLSKVSLTGTPRFDQARAEYRDIYLDTANSYRAKFGDYILVNSNFARAIHENGMNFTFSQKKVMNAVKSEADLEILVKDRHFIAEMVLYFVRAVEKIATKFKDKHIVIRPHPSDNQDILKRLVSEYPNIHVQFENSSYAWIRGAAALIHNGCTTAFEAVAMDIPTISYRPIQNYISDQYAANSISHQVYSENELIDTLSDLINGHEIGDSKRQRNELMKHISSLEGATGSENILSSLDNLDWDAALAPRKNKIDLQVKMNTQHTARCSGRYMTQKFPGLTLLELQDLIMKIQIISKRFEGTKAVQIHNNYFEII